MEEEKKICPNCQKEIREKPQGFCQNPKIECGCREKQTTDIGFGFCR